MNNKLHLSKVFNFISSTIFSNRDYVYDRNRVYDVTDTTELKLISSRRTFL